MAGLVIVMANSMVLLGMFNVEISRIYGLKMIGVGEELTSINGKTYRDILYLNGTDVIKRAIFSDNVLYQSLNHFDSIDDELKNAVEDDDTMRVRALKLIKNNLDDMTNVDGWKYTIHMPEGYVWIPTDGNKDSKKDKCSLGFAINLDNLNNIIEDKHDVIKKNIVKRISAEELTENDLLSMLTTYGRVTKG